MKRIYSAFFILIFGTVSCAHPSLSERDWVKSLQTKKGAIPLSNDQKEVNPYFANLAVWAILKTKPSESEIKFSERWIDWYVDHLNGPGPGLAVGGSIYDYSLSDGLEKTKLNYDSVDGYAGTFLMVLAQYYQATQDSVFIERHLQDILMVTGAIQSSLQDHLTVAKPDARDSYLMDNVEVWRGLTDLSLVLKKIGQKEKSESLQALALEIEKAIEEKLWDKKANAYLPFLGGSPRADSFYPEATAMLWPILFHLPEAEKRKKKIWADFEKRFKKKWQGAKADSFAWSFIAYLAVKMGDAETASLWEKMLSKKFPGPSRRPWPWHVGESAGYLLYLDSR